MPIAPTHAESEGHQKKNEKNYVTVYQEFFFHGETLGSRCQGASRNSMGNFPQIPNIETMKMVWLSFFPVCYIFSCQSKHLFKVQNIQDLNWAK